MKLGTTELTSTLTPSFVADPSAFSNTNSVHENNNSEHRFLDKLSSLIKSNDPNVSSSAHITSTAQAQNRVKQQESALQQKQAQQDRADQALSQKRKTDSMEQKVAQDKVSATQAPANKQKDSLIEDKIKTVEPLKTEKTMEEDLEYTSNKTEASVEEEITKENATDDKKEGEALLQRLVDSSSMLSGNALPNHDESIVLTPDEINQLEELAQKLLNGDPTLSDEELTKLQLLQSVVLQQPKTIQLNADQAEILSLKLATMSGQQTGNDNTNKMKRSMLLATTVGAGLTTNPNSHQPLGTASSMELAQLTAHNTSLQQPNQFAGQLGADMQFNLLDPNLTQPQSIINRQDGHNSALKMGSNTELAATSANKSAATHVAATGTLAATLNQLHETQQQKEIQSASAPLQFTKATAADALSERMQMMMSKNLKHVDIRLDPPELGKIQIKLTVDQGQTSVQFMVQNGQAKEMLEQSLPRLRELFATQGMDLAETNVSQQSDEDNFIERQFAEQETLPSKDQSQRTEEEHAEDINTISELKVASKDGGVDYYA